MKTILRFCRHCEKRSRADRGDWLCRDVLLCGRCPGLALRSAPPSHWLRGEDGLELKDVCWLSTYEIATEVDSSIVCMAERWRERNSKSRIAESDRLRRRPHSPSLDGRL